MCLKFLGLPLKQIKAVLNEAIDVQGALRLQREALEEKQRVTARAIDAIIEAEKAVRPGEPVDPATLRTLIGLIDAERVYLSRHFSEEAFANLKQFYEGKALSGEWIEEWNGIRRDVLASIGEDPTGETGRSLLAVRGIRTWTRRNAAALSLVSSPEVLEGLKKAGADKAVLTPGLVQRFRESSVAKVVPFLLEAMAALPPDA